MVYFTIVRHGQTPYNVRGVVQSRTGGELTEAGITMAKNLGVHLQGEKEKYTRVLCSDLHRCRLTMANILEELKDSDIPPVQYMPILRERDYGDWEFLAAKIVLDKVEESKLPLHKAHLVDVPNGESYQDVRARVRRFFEDICKIVDETADERLETENILAVSHGHFIVSLLDEIVEDKGAFEVTSFNEEALLKPAGNTSRTRFSISKRKDGEKRVINFTHIFNIDHLS